MFLLFVEKMILLLQINKLFKYQLDHLRMQRAEKCCLKVDILEMHDDEYTNNKTITIT